MIPSRHPLITALLLAAAAWPPTVLARQKAKDSGSGIGGLDAPPPAPPPRVEEDDSVLGDDLEKKRDERHRRERQDRPPPPPYSKKRQEERLQDSLTPHERGFLLEISALAGGVTTSGDRGGYTMDLTSHANLILRQDPKHHDGRIGFWYGLRLAPFAGTGFYKKVPGAYGLTYFGPMVGVGKIDPAPEDEGKARSNVVKGEVETASISGWLITGGIAAVQREGAGEAAKGQEKSSDFTSKGVAFDAPGVWLEARLLRIPWGAAGYDIVFGAQTGQGKVFVYGGLGAAAWN